jgi:single-strand DNA-binding protein
MIIVTIAGAAGKDAEAKRTQAGKGFCSFSLAGSVGYGDNRQTVWFDVTKWGEGADKLAARILKGTKVTVSGELSQREHNGKTYLQVRADHVALQGERSSGGGGGSPAYQEDLDDSVPFITANPNRERRVF